MKIEYIIPKKKTNIHDFIKKYKNKTFTIKNDKMEIEVKLEKIKSAINKFRSYNIKFKIRFLFYNNY